MTVVAAYLYRHGKRVREVSITEKIDCPSDKSEFVWIGICDPTEEEMQTLKEQYDLHPLAIEDAVKADQLPKVDIYGEQLSSLRGLRIWKAIRSLMAKPPSSSATAISSACATDRPALTSRCVRSWRRPRAC